MKIAYNTKGQLVEACIAIRGKNYICPYCGESQLNLRQGKVNAASFAHRKTSDRTPIQRTCPEYHDSECERITNPAQKLYILNGGIPVYLKSYKREFYLEAVFPQLSVSSMNYLRDNHVQLLIGKKKEKKNIYDYICYRIEDFTNKWIYVSLTVPCNIPEVKNKWLCGIQGLSDINNTVFRCSETGGARLPSHSRIYIGTKYILISKENITNHSFKNQNDIYVGDGILLKNIGVLKQQTHSEFVPQYNVYEFTITQNTKTSMDFVLSRYYTLCEEKTKITPIWPPAIIEGNQLTYADEQEAFFYKKTAKDEKIGYDYATDSANSTRIASNFGEIIKINPPSWYCLYTSFLENVMGKDKIERNTIQWYISTRKKIPEVFDSVYELHDKSGNPIYPGQIANKYDSVITSCNVKAELIIKQGEYIKAKTNGLITKDDFFDSVVVLNAYGYGRKTYDFSIKKPTRNKNYADINWDIITKNVYGLSNSPMISIDYSILHFYKKVPKSEVLLRNTFNRWLQIGKIPSDVSRYILKIIKERENI